MSSEGDAVAIRVLNLSKRYQIYSDPKDRLKQSIVPRLQRLVGRPSRQYFREFWALNDVSFDVRKGETVGVVGKNGAGKSTLLHLIVGTHAPTAGSIEVRGRVTALLELGSGFHPLFTGRENVYMNAAIIGMAREEVDRRFDEIARFADIGMFMEQPVNTYSSGMYLRLAFAVQVCLDPDILIVDEALAVGDAYFVHRCYHRIRQMKEQGKTILFVSHDTASVNNLCDRAIWISDGRLRLEGKPDDVTASYRADLFGIEMKQQPGRGASAFAVGRSLPVDALKRREPESTIPNSDRRMGGQNCRIVGLAVYGPDDRQPLSVARPGKDVLIRISIANVSVKPGTPLIVGYELFTPRGENLGGMNTLMAGFSVEAPAPGKTFTINARASLPFLRHGHYAFTPAVATHVDGRIGIEDRIENALVLEILGEMEVGGSWMRFPTSFALE
jgi:homopolymeric O-antigen transport system ATP-binding protein